MIGFEVHTILPVIHHIDFNTSLHQAEIAFKSGADGVFLISHRGDDSHLLRPASAIKSKFKSKLVGVNFLTRGPLESFRLGRAAEMDMIWSDTPGISSDGISHEANIIGQELAQEGTCPQFFASVAFKYQPEEPLPGIAASKAALCRMIPTTSGKETGAAPFLSKIKTMSANVNHGPLAIASGVSPANVEKFLPFVSHILVATGVSVDEHHFSENLMLELIERVRSWDKGRMSPDLGGYI
ncbi:hypothetical protein [Herbaspirillum frisingense]|uniref:hypothetical protein n=1 Tax=Herbaspirillum frisingense TaxID=92645 RepID=UPI00126793CF|nr:hypothetical protein [Herbaspirillum frisingense]